MKKYKVIISFLKRIWSLDKGYVLSVVGQTLLIALRTMVSLYIPKLLLDALASGQSFQASLPLVGLIVGVMTLLRLLENLMKRWAALGSDRISLKIEQVFSEKMMKLPYHYLEDPDYLEMKEAASMGMSIGAVDRLTRNLTGVLEHFSILLGLCLVLVRLNPWLVPMALGLQIIVAFFLVKQAQLFRDTLESILPINRKLNYFMGSIQDLPSQKDIRLYDMSAMLSDNILGYNRTMMADFIRMDGRSGVFTSLGNLISYFISGGMIFYAGARVLGHLAGPLISIGDFSLYTGAAVNFSNHFKEGMRQILDISNQIHFIEPIESFLALPEEKRTGHLPMEDLETLEFSKVSFQYPKGEGLILKDLSFKIKAGEKISVVGLNGAGKSTLIKLICRFFPVTSGEILINGHNIEDYQYDDYMAKISAVFQDFQLLNFTLAENILGEKHQDPQARQQALDLLEQVGLGEKIASLPHGLDTYLGKNFYEEGIEVSGGQLQKVAIARALYKKSDLVILDEPTSALDPLAEAEIYEHFNSLVQNKTAIYISHRMSSSIFCDRILLINNGSLEAFDSHANLMKNKESLYYKLFTTQAKNYLLKEEASSLGIAEEGL